jgi:hypothetical protein
MPGLTLMWKTLASFPQSLGKPCASSGFPTAPWITLRYAPSYPHSHNSHCYSYIAIVQKGGGEENRPFVLGIFLTGNQSVRTLKNNCRYPSKIIVA